ncbi:MAG: hypothetical protein KJ072_23145 [Verrucomicrobia bacterium]|nr:hypothetical protein [Verrucomicrobiota bacterium]
MSFFSSTKDLPQPKQKPLGLDERRISTNEQARPVPYFCGIARLAVTFISEAFAVKSKKIKMRVGKKKETVGYNYFASFAALIAHGPLDRLDAIWMDDEPVWEGPLARSGDFADITIESRGNVRLYWGTETQGQDPLLATSGTVHPAYRGQAYLVFDQLFFGRDRTNAPNIEVLVERWPNAPWLPTPNSIEDDVNPVIPLWDLWTNPRCGLGLPESRLDMDALAAAGEALNTEGIGVSPVITRAFNFRQFLVELCECFDAYPTYDSQGRLGLALVRESSATPVTVEPADLVDAPTLNPQGWPDTFNETFVRFTNRDKRFQEDSVAYRDRGNFQITQAVLSQTLSRLWITRQGVAQKIANAAGRVAAQPMLAGSMQVRKSKAVGLTVGGLFSLSFPQSGVDGVLCRVERLTLPAPGQATATVQFREDTGFFNADHYAAGADDAPEENVFEVQALGYEKLIEAPWEFKETSTPQIVFLASRGDLVSNGFNLWKQRSDLSYRDVGAFDNFAQRGQVVADYPAGTLLIDDYLGIEIQFDSLDNDLDEITFLEAQQNRLLVFVGNEILSAWNPQLVAAGRYRLWAVRARYDTKRETHAADAEVWVALRDDLAMRSDDMSPPDKTFKLQPFLLQSEFDLALVDLTSITLQKRAYRPLAPLNLRVADDGWNPTYGTGADIVADWDKAANRSSEDPVTKVLSPDIDQTVLEVLTTGDVLKGTFEFSGGTGPKTITNAQLVAALGSETDFKLRAWFVRSGLRSLNHDEVTVRKV